MMLYTWSMSEELKDRITITIDAELLRRVDAVADARAESRSAIIERIVKNEIVSEERFLKVLEVPVTRLIVEKIMGSPTIAGVIAEMVGNSMTQEERKALSDFVLKQGQRGRERQEAKRGARGVVPEGG